MSSVKISAHELMSETSVEVCVRVCVCAVNVSKGSFLMSHECIAFCTVNIKGTREEPP